MVIGIVASKEFFAISEAIGSRDYYKPLTRDAGLLDPDGNVVSQLGISYWKQNKTSRHFDIYAIRCNIGELAAAAATQALIDYAKVDLIVNFGMAHSLRNKAEQTLHVVNDVIHYDFNVAECNPTAMRGEYPQFSDRHIEPDKKVIEKLKTFNPPLPFARCASGDTFVVKDSTKEKMRNEFDADICDMNSAGVLITCEANYVPCLILKGITDGQYNGAYSWDTKFNFDAIASFRQALSVLEFLTE